MPSMMLSKERGHIVREKTPNHVLVQFWRTMAAITLPLALCPLPGVMLGEEAGRQGAPS